MRGRTRAKGSFTEGFRYVWRRPDLKAILVMLFLIGTFGLNFPIFISTMAVSVFHADARGLRPAVVDHGDRHGGRRAVERRPRTGRASACCWSAPRSSGSAARWPPIAPSYWFFAGALVVIGVAALTFTNTTNSLMQLSTEPAMRGRVMALRVAIALGGTPIGAPIVGWVADTLRPALGARRRRGVGLRSPPSSPFLSWCGRAGEKMANDSRLNGPASAWRPSAVRRRAALALLSFPRGLSERGGEHDDCHRSDR